MKRYQKLLVYALVLLVAVGAGIGAMLQKDGWHIDEIATLGLSNGSIGGYITAYDDEQFGRGAFIRDVILGDSLGETIENAKAILADIAENGLSGFSIRDQYVAYRAQSSPIWKSGADFADYLRADGFSLSDVYINQALDTHPPLYYLCVRLSCALGSGAFSLWPMFWVNMAFLAGICVLLLRMGERRFGSIGAGICAALAFTLCNAGLSLAVYMRMYMALCFFVLWSLDAHIALWQNQWQFNRKISLQIVFSCALGFLTHYYFAIWAVLTAAMCLICMRIEGKSRRFWAYLRKMALGAGLSLVVWPFSVVHLLLSNRSAEAFGAISGGALTKIAAGALIFLRRFPVLPLALFSAVGWKKLQKPILLIGVPSALYLLVVFVIAPYDDLRYMSCALAPLSALLGVGIWQILCRFRTLTDMKKLCVGALACALCAGSTLILDEPMYLYRETEEAKRFVRQHEGELCVYLTGTGAAFFREMPDFAAYSEVLIVTKQELSMLAEDEKIQEAGAFVLYVHDSISQTQAIHAIEDLTGFTDVTVFVQSHPGLDARAYFVQK